MPALWFNQTRQEIFHLRRQRQRWRDWCRCQLQRRSQFLRQVRHGQTAFALNYSGFGVQASACSRYGDNLKVELQTRKGGISPKSISAKTSDRTLV